MIEDKRIVMLAQEALNARGAKPKLVVDGWRGPKMEAAMAKLLPYQESAVKVSAATSFAEALAKVAEGEVGVREAGGNNRGQRIEVYQRATWLAVGAWPWCAAFVCWSVKQAAQLVEVTFRLPETAGAWDFENWATSQRSNGAAKLIKPAPKTIQRGDILVYTHSHIGIAATPAKSGKLWAIEGNTNGEGSREGDGVYRKERALTQIRSVIRFA